MKSVFLVSLVWLGLFWGFPVHPEAGGTESPPRLPPLEEAVRLGIQAHPEMSPAEVAYEIKKNLYLISTRKEQLGIADEVRGHFEKAVTKAEEKMETGEGEVTQSAITKLKLGLSGTLNDIATFNAEMAEARLNLSYWLKREVPEDAEPSEDGLYALEFSYSSLGPFLKAQDVRKKIDRWKILDLKKQLVKINQAREKMMLARKNRRITRALLVTEVANYDFGIGDEGDLFEALIIYTRVLVGYYDSIYKFNLSVLELQKEYAALPS